MRLGITLGDDGFFFAGQQRKASNFREVTAQRIKRHQRGLALGRSFCSFGLLEQRIGIVGRYMIRIERDVGVQNDFGRGGIVIGIGQQLDFGRFSDGGRTRFLPGGHGLLDKFGLDDRCRGLAYAFGSSAFPGFSSHCENSGA